MQSFMLGMVLLAGIDEATDIVVREHLIIGCINTVLPGSMWEQEAAREISRRQLARGVRLTDCLLADQLNDLYDDHVVLSLTAFFCHNTTFNEQLFIASNGKCGKSPSVWVRLRLLELLAAYGTHLQECQGTF